MTKSFTTMLWVCLACCSEAMPAIAQEAVEGTAAGAEAEQGTATGAEVEEPGTIVAVETGQRTIDSSIIVMGMPVELGVLERPAVEFPHGKHTEALEEEGCEACHGRNEEGRLSPALEKITAQGDWDALTNQYHDLCMGCHRDRSKKDLKAGPVICGECHERRSPAISTLAPLSFDYGLHFRHQQAMEEKCEECHHALNEQTKKLEYREGEEDACRRCHLDVDQGKNYSLRNATHLYCISCHLERAEKQLEGGPVRCNACHEPERQQEIARPSEFKRLLRGQKDQVWIYDLEAKARMVPFDHQAHESSVDFCTECHVEGKAQACNDCHSLRGEQSTEMAYHLPTAGDTCVGCHKKETEKSECAGCHSMQGTLDGGRACDICHSGPMAQVALFAESAPFPDKVELDTLMVHLNDLGATDDDFPDTVTIGTLADAYEPVEMPHRSIVIRLDSVVRGSTLATRFHAQTETLCAGCHHHSPIGNRPTSCGSCHGEYEEVAQDMPSLEIAYHRQCIGCHQKMGIEKQGCTDCHAKASEEVEE